MNFNKHSTYKDQHAFLGASSYHWINYTPEKLDETYIRMMAKEKGTRLHAFAAEAILLGIKLPNDSTTLNMYVNDAIGFKMTPEQILFYSENCFGTADSISFNKNFLRIHDLKTGETKTSIHQLEIYDSLFCLEYNKDPREIKHELRIYQNNEIKLYIPDPGDILNIMDTIVLFDKRIEKLKLEA